MQRPGQPQPVEAQPPCFGDVLSEGLWEPSPAALQESSCFRKATGHSPGWDVFCRLEELPGALQEAAIPAGFVGVFRVSWANDAQKSVHRSAPSDFITFQRVLL